MYLGFLLLRLRAISLTAWGWDITMLKPYWWRWGHRWRSIMFPALKSKLYRFRTGLTSNWHKPSVTGQIKLPGSSWWLSDTWYKREHHLSCTQVVSSWEFDDSAACWIESPESNYKQKIHVSAPRWLLVLFIHYVLLPDGVSSCSGYRGGWWGEAAVTMEIFYRTTPGRVDGRHLASSLWLFSIKPEHKKFVKCF